MRRLRIALVLAAVGAALANVSCGSTPTSPDRHGPITVTVQCEPASAQLTRCRAPVSCGLYGCYPGTPDDLTSRATWTVENAAVARIVAPGQVEAVGPGDTVVRASDASVGEGSTPVSVFPGTAPLPTLILTGSVADGSIAAHPPLDGATVQILDGLVAGRIATSGVAPPFMPGYWGPTGFFRSGDYEFFGIPKGTYTVRVSRPGYVTQQRAITIGSTPTQFVLERAE